MTLPTTTTLNGCDDDSDMFGPPRSSPPIGYRSRVPMISPKLRQREERKRILQLCAHKLERIKDSETNLRRSVCINNTYCRLTDELRREKQSRYLANLPKSESLPETARDNIFNPYNSCGIDSSDHQPSNKNNLYSCNSILNNCNDDNNNNTNNSNNNNNDDNNNSNSNTVVGTTTLDDNDDHIDVVHNDDDDVDNDGNDSNKLFHQTTPTTTTANNNNDSSNNKNNKNTNNNIVDITSTSSSNSVTTISSTSNIITTTTQAKLTVSSASDTNTTYSSSTNNNSSNNFSSTTVQQSTVMRQSSSCYKRHFHHHHSSNTLDTDLEILDRELNAINSPLLIDPEITQGAEQLEKALLSSTRKRGRAEDESDRLVREALSQFYIPPQRLISAIEDCPLDLMSANAVAMNGISMTATNNMMNGFGLSGMMHMGHHHHHHHHQQNHLHLGHQHKRARLDLPDTNPMNNHQSNNNNNINNNNNNNVVSDLELDFDMNPNQKDFEVIMDALRLGTPSPTPSSDSCGQAAMMLSESASVFHNLVVTSLET